MSQVDFVQHEEAECFAEEDGIIIEMSPGSDVEIKVRVVRPRGKKCPRCWNYREDFVESVNICARCQ